MIPAVWLTPLTDAHSNAEAELALNIIGIIPETIYPSYSVAKRPI